MSYANKYYDPVKAHEYYEKYKKLKGRRSTKGMTDSQKAMAGYVKDKLNTEKKQKIQDVSDSAKNSRESVTSKAKQTREAFSRVCTGRIAMLRKQLKSMSPDERAFAKQKIEKQILNIRTEFSKKKTDVTSKAKNFRTEINAGAKIEKSNIRKEYNNKYTEALQDIRNNVK